MKSTRSWNPHPMLFAIPKTPWSSRRPPGIKTETTGPRNDKTEAGSARRLSAPH
jgi:hypothetical protein